MTKSAKFNNSSPKTVGNNPISPTFAFGLISQRLNQRLIQDCLSAAFGTVQSLLHHSLVTNHEY